MQWQKSQQNCLAVMWKKEIVSARCTVMQLRRSSRDVLTLLPGFFLLLIGQGKRRELLTVELLNKKEAGWMTRGMLSLFRSKSPQSPVSSAEVQRKRRGCDSTTFHQNLRKTKGLEQCQLHKEPFQEIRVVLHGTFNQVVGLLEAHLHCSFV